MQSFTEGQAVEILERGEWIGPFTVTAHKGRTADHLVLNGPSGLFEEYNDAPYNVRPVEVAPVEVAEAPVEVEAPAKVRAATSVRSQDYCPRCDRLVALHADGTFYIHGPRAKRCAGSGQDPMQAQAEADKRAERADRMGRAERIDADVERITSAHKTPRAMGADEWVRVGDSVEYLHTGTRTWVPAVLQSFRAYDNAVLVTREDGTTDAAPLANVRPAPRLYSVEANSSSVAYPVRAANMHDAIRVIHTESKNPAIEDGLTPDSGYASNVDEDGASHFIVDEVNVYTVRELEGPGETLVRVARKMDGAPGTLREITSDGWIVDMDHGSDVLGERRAWSLLPTLEADREDASEWDARKVEDIRKGDRIAFHATSEGRNVLDTWPVGEEIAIAYDEAGAPTITKEIGTRVWVRRQQNERPPAVRRAEEAVALVRAIVPAEVGVERLGRKVFVFAGQQDRGFMLTFSERGQTMSTPDTLRHTEVEALHALTTIRKHFTEGGE